MKNYSDWERFGDNIQKTVQRAVDSKDFRSLNRTITNTINRAMDNLMGGNFSGGCEWNEPLAKGWNGQGENWESQPEYRNFSSDNSGGDYQRKYGKPENNTYEAYSSGQETSGHPTSQLYTKTALKRLLGWTLAVVGYGGGIVTLLGFLITGAAGIFIGSNPGISIALFTTGIITIPLIVMGILGSRLLGRLRRFGEYIRVIGSEQFYNVSDLAKRLERKPSQVIKDLKWMIRKGWLLQGHLDDQNTCLMVSETGYREYRRLMRQREEINRAEAEAKAEKEQKAQQDHRKKAALDPQIQEIIRTGNDFIDRIRECNDAIPGEEVSEKIYRMELLTRKIFERVEAEACDVSDIRRLMEYYLPTAIKLLEAYEELDRQEIQGENILSSKREIEDTLDTLNTAFEKLLDSLFQETAWDVSSDISVLKTMLAQEGLTGSDFKGGN